MWRWWIWEIKVVITLTSTLLLSRRNNQTTLTDYGTIYTLQHLVAIQTNLKFSTEFGNIVMMIAFASWTKWNGTQALFDQSELRNSAQTWSSDSAIHMRSLVRYRGPRLTKSFHSITSIMLDEAKFTTHTSVIGQRLTLYLLLIFFYRTTLYGYLCNKDTASSWSTSFAEPRNSTNCKPRKPPFMDNFSLNMPMN